MGAVFFSYAHEDRKRVEALVEALEREGFDVWWDRRIPIASTYEEHISQQLGAAAAVVVTWSQASVASRYVRWEAHEAQERAVLVPVLLEPARLPPEYFLIQAADLTRWEGSTADPEWQGLVAALRRLVGTTPPAPVASAPPPVASAPPPVASAPPPVASPPPFVGRDRLGGSSAGPEPPTKPAATEPEAGCQCDLCVASRRLWGQMP